MKKRTFNPITLFGVIFGTIGILFLIMGSVFFIVGIRDNMQGESVAAHISHIDHKRNNVYIEYEYNGREYYDIPLDYYSSGMYEGKKMDVKVDPENPTHITSSVGMILGGAFGGFGLLFTVIAGIVLIKYRKKKLLGKQLIEEGYYVDAKIESVETTNIRVNRRFTYLIRCAYHDPYDGKIYSFKSEALMFDPSPYIDFDNDTIRVYVKRDDFTKNYVDVSEFKDKYIEC